MTKPVKKSKSPVPLVTIQVTPTQEKLLEHFMHLDAAEHSQVLTDLFYQLVFYSDWSFAVGFDMQAHLLEIWRWRDLFEDLEQERLLMTE